MIGAALQAAAPLQCGTIKLPADLRKPRLSVHVFKTYLKTYLFRSSYGPDDMVLLIYSHFLFTFSVFLFFVFFTIVYYNNYCQ